MDTRRINTFLKSRSFRHGLPFLVLVVGGSFGLKEFTSTRYTLRKQVTLSRQDEDANTINQRQESLEEYYDKTKNRDINNWTNIRGPRPWENSRQMQAEQRSALSSLSAGLKEKNK